MLLAMSSHHWYSLRWFDWVSVAGLALAMVGLLFTWLEARKATNAAKATQNAIEQTEQQIRSRLLIALIPQLRQTMTDIDSAIHEDNWHLTCRNLDSWREQTSNIIGILEAVDSTDPYLRKRLVQSVGLAGSAQKRLRADGSPVQPRCIEARAAIGSAYDELQMWIGRHSTMSGISHGGRQ